MTETNIEQKSSNTYLILSIGVLIAGMVLFYYFSDIRLFYRVLGMITVLILSGYIGYQSDFGKLVYSYVTDSKVELKKVTWPTKPEVITTTIMVFIFVFISSIFFLLVDKIISFVVKYLLFL